ncbi:hypothetical protein F4808DRAFT_464763 [Astrocystis sublimbata]|nr:hypothetical protein F4808DRAFT_464763 [Astrocystis sublimbata]
MAPIQANTQLKKLIMLAAFGAIFGLSQAASPTWYFSCYSNKRDCNDDEIGPGAGDTNGRGEAETSCMGINSKGCQEFSWDGAGTDNTDYSVCLYSSADCTGGGYEESDGRNTCLTAGNPRSWKVVENEKGC